MIAFVQRTDGLSFAEAVERLADRGGVRLRYEQGGAAPSRPQGQRSRLVEANRHGRGVLHRAAAARSRGRSGPRLPHRPRLRPGRVHRAVRLRLRAGRLGRAHLPPARPRLQPGRAGHRRAVPAVQPRLADRPVPPQAALADPGHLRGRGRLRRPPAARRRPDRGQIPQHPGDAALPQVAGALRRRHREEGDRPAPAGGGGRGLHRRDGLPPGRGADGGGDLRHRVRPRAHRGAAPAAARLGRVRRRDGVRLRRRRGRAAGRAASVHRGPAVRRCRRSSRSRRPGSTRATCG